MSIPARIARAAVLYAAYLGKTLWPVNLAAFYPMGPSESCWPALGAGALLALLTAGALWGAWRGQRWLAVGWFWFLGTLAPTIGLVQAGLQVMANRFLYLPQIGLSLALVWGLGSRGQGARSGEQGAGEKGRCSLSPLPPRSLSPFLPFSSALLLACLMVCAWRQTGYWRDSETLWTHTLACAPRNPTAHDFLGTELAGQGKIDAGIAHYLQALDIQPDYVEAHYNLGVLLAGRGQIEAAIAHYQAALEIRPDYAQARYNLGAAFSNLGVALARRGQVNAAIVQYRKALEINRDCADAHNNLANSLANRGELDAAIAHYQAALEIQPDYAEAHYNLGNALAGRERADEALAQYREALDLAAARNQKTLTDAIRAKIGRMQAVRPASEAP